MILPTLSIEDCNLIIRALRFLRSQNSDSENRMVIDDLVSQLISEIEEAEHLKKLSEIND